MICALSGFAYLYAHETDRLKRVKGSPKPAFRITQPSDRCGRFGKGASVFDHGTWTPALQDPNKIGGLVDVEHDDWDTVFAAQ